MEKSGKAEHGVGDDIVAEDGLPADGKAAVKHQLQKAVYDACEHAGAKSPACAVDEYRQHAYADRAALRQLKELDVAEHLRQCYHDSALAQGAELEMTFAFHFFFPPIL